MIRGYTRETFLDLSKTRDDNIKFSTSILRIKNNNYRTAHGHIRPQSGDEQGINKLRPKQAVIIRSRHRRCSVKKRCS